MGGSRELIEDLRDAGHPVVLASSAKEWEVEHYLDLLDAREIVDGWTTRPDVEQTKPEPDLIKAALAKVGGAGAADDRDAILIGDTVWDEGGKACGIETRGAHRRVSRGGAPRGRREGGLQLSRRAAARRSPREPGADQLVALELRDDGLLDLIGGDLAAELVGHAPRGGRIPVELERPVDGPEDVRDLAPPEATTTPPRWAPPRIIRCPIPASLAAPRALTL